MDNTSAAHPEVFPGTATLDDLELVRLGLLPHTVLTVASSCTVVDAEGVTVAVAGQGGEVAWHAQRSSRPFEAWHVHDGDPSIEPPTVLVADAEGLGKIPTGTRTVLLLASTDGEDSDHAIALARQAVDAAAAAGAELRIVPLRADSPGWRSKVEEIGRRVDAAGLVHDLTTQPPAYPEPTTQGVVVLLTGLSGSGKSTLARALRNRLVESSPRPVTLLDGDVVRRHLSAGLGFGRADRETNVRRIGWVAAEVARHGGTAIASPIAPFAASRDEMRRMVEAQGGRFVLVHVATPLEECERRDRKGLYARARAGEIADFTGISSPYEEPTSPTLRLDTTGRPVPTLVDEILSAAPSLTATTETSR